MKAILKALGKGALVGLIACALIAGGMWVQRYKDAQDYYKWPSESWQEIKPDKYSVVSPPGYMWIFEVNEEGLWRQYLMPIPKKWNVPSNYVSPKDLREKQFRREKKFDDQLDLNVIETSKKKKKSKEPDGYVDGVHTDTNGDGILEFDYPLIYTEHDNGGVSLSTGWQHGCCSCSLWHDVSLVVYYSGLQWRIYQRWEVDPQRTTWQRKKKWGCDPFMPGSCIDPFKEQPRYPFER
jgi:hypothetical protein